MPLSTSLLQRKLRGEKWSQSSRSLALCRWCFLSDGKKTGILFYVLPLCSWLGAVNPHNSILPSNWVIQCCIPVPSTRSTPYIQLVSHDAAQYSSSTVVLDHRALPLCLVERLHTNSSSTSVGLLGVKASTKTNKPAVPNLHCCFCDPN